jgi:hypothetical protein
MLKVFDRLYYIVRYTTVVSENLIKMTMKITAFCDVMPNDLVEILQTFGESAK